jgi:hypothetical protein
MHEWHTAPWVLALQTLDHGRGVLMPANSITFRNGARDMPNPRIFHTPLDVKNAVSLSINPDSGRLFISNVVKAPFVDVPQLQALDIDRAGKKTFSKSIPLPQGSAGVCPVENDEFILIQNNPYLQAVRFDAQCNAVETVTLTRAKSYPSVRMIYDSDIQTIFGVGFTPGSTPAEIFSITPNSGTFLTRPTPLFFDLEPCLAYDPEAKTLLVGKSMTQFILSFDVDDFSVKSQLTFDGFDLRALTVTETNGILKSLVIVGATSAGEDQANEAIHRDRFLIIRIASNPSEAAYISELSEGLPDFKLVNNEAFAYVIDVEGITQFSLEKNRAGPSIELPNGIVYLRPEVIMDKAKNRIHLLNVNLDSPNGDSELITIDCASL